MAAPELEDAVNVSALESERFGDTSIDNLAAHDVEAKLERVVLATGFLRSATFQPRWMFRARFCATR